MKDEDQEPIYEEAFVRIPWELAEGEGMPIEEAKALRLVVSEFEDCGDRFQLEKGDTPEAVLSDARMLLRMRRMEWEETRNPVAAIEATITAYKAGLFPPLWALKWLCEGLDRWHKNGDTIRLDVVLGLRKEREGRGGSNKTAFRAASYSLRNASIAWEAWMLRHTLGVSLEEAAGMICRRLRPNDPDGKAERQIKNIASVPDPVPDWLAERWRNITKEEKAKLRSRYD